MLGGTHVSNGQENAGYYRYPALHQETIVLVAENGSMLKWRGFPSPDSKRLPYSDKNTDQWGVDLATQKPTRVSSNREGIKDMVWSPDKSFEYP